MLEEVMVNILGQLKRLADTQEKMLACAERKYGGPEAESPKPDAAPVDTVGKGPSFYDELKEALQARGVVVKKGTKLTTLMKEWTVHKDDPILQTIKAEAPVNEAAIPESEGEVEEPPRCEETTAPASAKPMTEVEARMHIMAKGYKGTPEQIVLMKKALASVGKAKFAELKEGEYEKLIEEFDRLVAASDSFLGDK